MKLKKFYIEYDLNGKAYYSILEVEDRQQARGIIKGNGTLDITVYFVGEITSDSKIEDYDGYKDCTFMSENTLESLYNEAYLKLERKYKNERN